jgi:hypothetical protein
LSIADWHRAMSFAMPLFGSAAACISAVRTFADRKMRGWGPLGAGGAAWAREAMASVTSVASREVAAFTP